MRRGSLVPILLAIFSVMGFVLLLALSERFRPAREAVGRGMAKISGDRMEVEVRVLAKQFSWHFQYPGDDGVFGRTSTASITGDNPMGIDFSDPAAADDLVSGELVLPCDAEVRLGIESADVIHALGELEGNFYEDALPGVRSNAEMNSPTEARSGRLRCKQLCGSGHKDHHAPYRFLEKVDYLEWLVEQGAGVDRGS